MPYGSYTNVLKTKDDSPLEPGVVEHKYYAKGVGSSASTSPEYLVLIPWSLTFAVSVRVPCVGVLRTAIGRPALRRRQRHPHRPARTG